MSLHMKRTEVRSQLQDKLSKDLQERAKQKAEKFDQPDGITDSAYIKNTKQTSSLAWVWVLVFAAILVTVIWLITLTF